jgi:hypothetical protein
MGLEGGCGGGWELFCYWERSSCYRVDWLLTLLFLLSVSPFLAKKLSIGLFIIDSISNVIMKWLCNFKFEIDWLVKCSFKKIGSLV